MTGDCHVRFWERLRVRFPWSTRPKNIEENISFKDITWLAKNTKLPIIIKGIVDPDDFQLAHDHGASCVIISNHGGRQMDGCVSTIESLKYIYHLGNKLPLPFIIDGGFQRGSDIVKALAMGAEAVFLGRPILWGLAVNGQDGVKDILNKLIIEVDNSFALCGSKNLEELRKIKISF